MYPGHSAVLYLTGNGAWPAAEQNHPPAHHSSPLSALVSPHTSPAAAPNFWSEPATPEPYEEPINTLLDGLHGDNFQQQPAEPVLPIDWQITPHAFALLYQSLDAPIPNIDEILERNRVRLEGSQPSAPPRDMWADYPAAGVYAYIPRDAPAPAPAPVAETDWSAEMWRDWDVNMDGAGDDWYGFLI